MDNLKEINSTTNLKNIKNFFIKKNIFIHKKEAIIKYCNL